MGQDSSTTMRDGIPPESLPARTVQGVARYIKTGRAKNVVIMAGAGISTSAGIPDFRSPETGLYANLAELNLPFAEAVFDIGFFRQNPLPFYTLAKELYPGSYQPTITHCFFRLLHEKGLLLKLFTQNIDCLERQAGVPPDKIVEAHGSFATQRCIDCKTTFPDEEMRRHVMQSKVPRCNSCQGLVKPDIVFFGEQLPGDFHRNRHLPAKADMCIVLGTSLQVQPFASLPSFCRDGVPRVLINMERVGGLGSRADDVLMLGDCDQGVRQLAEACGWLDDLDAIWQATSVTPPESQKSEQQESETRYADGSLEADIASLTEEVDKTLRISKSHQIRTKELIDIEADREAPRAVLLASQDEGLSHVFPHLKKSCL